MRIILLMTSLGFHRSRLGWLPAPVRTAGWKTLRWLKHERPGLLMLYVGKDRPVSTALPAGFVLRPWREGDDAAWLALLNESAAFGLWTEARFAETIVRQPREAQFFVATEEALVASAGVIDRPLHKQPGLEIAWVVRHPSHRGQQLGLTVLHAALGCALTLPGSRKVHLYTDDHRLTAIQTYLDIGFIPDFRSHRSYSRRWASVMRELAQREEDIASAQEPPEGRSD